MVNSEQRSAVAAMNRVGASSSRILCLQSGFGWQEVTKLNCRIAFAGTPGDLEAILRNLEDRHQDQPDLQRLMRSIEAWPGHFACIVETANYVLAFVDRIRSYPVVYRTEIGEQQVSNSPYALASTGRLVLDETASLELRTANYVTGARTLFQGVMQLQPGEAILFCKDGSMPVHCKYTSYQTNELVNRTEASLIEEHDAAISAIFRRVADEADGCEIWIPLSAGLDSRLVLAKLKDLGFPRLRTFSYGPPGNDDAKGASVVARELGVPWTFIPYTKREIRDFFWSEERKAYWRFAACGTSVPFMVDEFALRQLISTRELLDPSKAIVINGQSGDFTSGGHLLGKHLDQLDPENRYPLSLIVGSILKKHYGQRRCSDEEKRLFAQLVMDKIGVTDGEYQGQELAKFYEFWEAEERQAKYVVNGQRSYDYVGLQWRLPLWDRELFNFWRKVPYRFKIGQSLYKAYLRSTNYCGVFKDREFSVENFHGWGRAIFPIARLAGLVAGQDVKDQTYRLGAYFGKYANHYAPFGFRSHLRDVRRLQSPLGHYAETLLAELPS